jgi:NAD(P)-dependent dehydrogenase (short-subunit alcohol dehydrogenase family)
MPQSQPRLARVSNLPQTPSFRLDGRRALVTGASRGLGLACASALADAGAHVTLVSRTYRDVDSAAQALREAGGSADAMQLDVSDLGAVSRQLDAIDGFDILVNNAGTNKPMPFVDVTHDVFDALCLLNLRAPFFVARRLPSV